MAKKATATKKAKSEKSKKTQKTDAVQKKAFERPEVPFNVFDNAVIVQISCRKPGNTKQMSVSDVEVDMDKSMLKAFKTLLNSPELKKIVSFDSSVYLYMLSQQISSKTGLALQRGSYLIPLNSVEAVLTKLKEFESQRAALVEDFIANYNTRKEEARIQLREQYDESNYISVDKIKREFSFSFGVKAESTPKSLETISSAIFKEELRKAQESSKDLAVDIANTLRNGFKSALMRLIGALTPKDDGKRRKIYDSNIENWMTFLNTFQSKNIVQDKDLEGLVITARKMIAGEKDAGDFAQKVRMDDTFRQKVLKDLQSLEKGMDTLVIVEDSRDINIDELD